MSLSEILRLWLGRRQLKKSPSFKTKGGCSLTSVSDSETLGKRKR